MSVKLDNAIALIEEGRSAFFKFISANETGETGGHQYGFYIPKDFANKVLGRQCVPGENLDVHLDISWNDEIKTHSRLVYYGVGTRDEARITQFGRGFKYIHSEYTGALVLFIMESPTQLHSLVLNYEEEINEFLGALGLSPTDANKIISIRGLSAEEREREAINNFIASYPDEFPDSYQMSLAAQSIENAVYNHIEEITQKPDAKLLKWSGLEYRLFRAIEDSRYFNEVHNGFPSVDRFISFAQEVLNRRKSRAGKSLEHHLSALFKGNGLEFEEQVITEENKRPDFIFPSANAYHDASFPTSRLTFLAAKTTCKDRWRQILNEADRFRGRTKYLCTLQQGMSIKQMDEMSHEQVVLVVPKDYIRTYPRTSPNQLITIEQFIAETKTRQGGALG